MDEADMAQHQVDMFLAASILKHQNSLKQCGTYEPGRCRNCNETISTGSFCDSDCRIDFEDRQKAAARRGK